MDLLEKNRSMERRTAQLERDSRRLNIVVPGLQRGKTTRSYNKSSARPQPTKISVSGMWTLKTKAIRSKIIATCENLEDA